MHERIHHVQALGHLAVLEVLGEQVAATTTRACRLGADWGNNPTQFDFDGEMVTATATVAGSDVLLDLEAVVDLDADRDLVLWRIAADQFEFRLEETGHD